MRTATFGLAVALSLGGSSGAVAVPAPQQSDEQICRSRADELKLGDKERDTFLRECVAGERLIHSEDPAK